MRIAVISDEISDDLEEATQLGTLLGVTLYELRWVRLAGTFRRRRAGDLTDDEAAALAGEAEHQGVSISAISPRLFSDTWGNGCSLEGEMERLERAFRVAERLGARDVVIHGFRPPDGRRSGVCPAGVVEALRSAAERAQAAGLRLLLRNDAGCYADTGAHTASIVHAVHSPALGISWDPCQAARTGEGAICEGYEWVAPFVRDVRVKDQAQHDGLGFEYAVLDQGCMDWKAQLRALLRDAYEGTVTLGPQMEPRLLNTMHSLEALQSLLREVQQGFAHPR